MTVTGKDLEIHYEGEWAALYVNGNLEEVGDSYHAEERAFELLGVTTIQDDAFMRGQTQRSGVANTLAEVEEYRVARRAALDLAASLREQAAVLLAEADEAERAHSG